MKGVTQKKIASDLKVSQALVSMVLSGRRNGISNTTAQHILDYAKKVGYFPRSHVQNFTHNQEGGAEHMGIVLRTGLNLSRLGPFFSEVLQAVHDKLASNNVRMIFVGSESDLDPEKVKSIVKLDSSMRGLIIFGETQPGFIEGLCSLRLPVVYVSARKPGFCHSVVPNEIDTSHLLFKELFRCGHQRFAFLGCDIPKSRNEERLQAVLSSSVHYGLSPDEIQIVGHSTASLDSGRKLAEELLQIPPESRPTAWIAVGGTVARGAMGRLIMEPNDYWRNIGVVSMDLTEICTLQEPTITAAGPDPNLLGSTTAKLLLNALPRTKPHLLSDMVVPSEIIVGESTRIQMNSVSEKE